MVIRVSLRAWLFRLALGSVTVPMLSDLVRHDSVTSIYLFGWIDSHSLRNLNSGDSSSSGIGRIDCSMEPRSATSHFFE